MVIATPRRAMLSVSITITPATPLVTWTGMDIATPAYGRRRVHIMLIVVINRVISTTTVTGTRALRQSLNAL